jgi:ribonuclease-3
LSSSLTLRQLQGTIGYRFRDESKLQQALTHRSAGVPHNERLEFLGDSILGLEISLYLFERYQSADEGQLSRMRAQLVKKDTLASIAKDIDLGAYLALGAGELRSGGQSRDSILADAVEAIIAATYLDGGLGEARAMIHRLFGQRMSAVDPTTQRKDPKTRLQEYLQSQRKELPQYSVVDIRGDAHEQTFFVRCELPDSKQKTEGQGASRRKAEQAAAREMLTKLDVSKIR